MFDGAAGGIDEELARGNQGERGLVNGNAVDVDDEGKSVVMEYRSDDESVDASESDCDDVADDESVDTSESDCDGDVSDESVDISESDCDDTANDESVDTWV